LVHRSFYRLLREWLLRTSWTFWACGTGYAKKWLPYFLARFRVIYNEQIVSKKRELFSNLQEFAGSSGKLSLLELGCGTGTNFKFYPPGCRVACVDPNPNFERFLIKSIAENRHLQFERFVVSTGEDMHQVADGSLDVVVCTLVLCSVKNQDRVLQEVCRVLRPVSVGRERGETLFTCAKTRGLLTNRITESNILKRKTMNPPGGCLPQQMRTCKYTESRLHLQRMSFIFYLGASGVIYIPFLEQ
uniref:Methyltransferase type 11 domain-containing protein n=1 Tax=Sus scrofa TaxID=9823 RepID=A0A8D1FI75_PIG